MMRTPKPAVITALPFILGVFFLGSGAGLPSHSGHSQEATPSTGSVLVHRAMKYDVSRPLASMRALDDVIALADCKGAACGESPRSSSDDPEEEQERRPDEAIPPPAP